MQSDDEKHDQADTDDQLNHDMDEFPLFRAILKEYEEKWQ